MISEQDGILNRAGNASVQNDVATRKKKIKLELMGKYDANGKYTNADVIDAVENVTGHRVEEKTKKVLSKNGNDVDISDIWVPRQLNEIKIGETITAKSEYYETETGYKITIPEGYTITEDSATEIKDGIVITDSVDENGKSIGNEFVWIPVQNAIAETEADITTMVNNKQYPIAVKTGEKDSNGNTAYRGVLYDFSSSNGTVSITAKSYSATSGDREPAYLERSDDYGDASQNGIKYLQNIVGFTQNGDELKTAWINQMQTEFDEMVENVASTGGFYISRYEISGSIDSSGNITTESKPGATAFTGATTYKDDYLRWYGLYKAGKNYRHDGIQSTMIWGSQYDQMLIWMTKNGIDVTQISSDKNTNPTITGVSGSKDVINKIYDLYGGRREWTLEGFDPRSRVYRGGHYFDDELSPTYRDANTPIYYTPNNSSRLTLYVR